MPDKDNFGAIIQPTTVRSGSIGGFKQDDVGGTIRSNGGDNQGGSESLVVQPVPYRKSKRAQSTTDDKTWVQADQANTLNAFDTGERDTHAIPCVNMQGSKSNACVTQDGSSYSINAMHGHDIHAIAVGTDCYNGAVTGDVAATMGTPGNSVNASGPTVMSAMTVRRLTPRECERLQGFPDDYTLIPWRKKPAADCPDGPRYKALGNSMATNCMAWIGERIAAYEAKELTP